MDKRAAGALLCLTSGILFAARYIAAAIFMSGVSTWSHDLFEAGLNYVGSPLLIFSVIFLVAGIFYLIRAEKKAS